MTRLHVSFVLWLAALSGCPAPPQPPSTPPPTTTTAPEPTPESLVADAAAAVCGALTRCCDARSTDAWFAPWVALETLDDLDARLPPAAPLDGATCPAVVGELFLRRPFGAWLAAVAAEEVAFTPSGAAACLEALSSPCGPELAEALTDPTCFAFGPPSGGDEQRRMFARTRDSGACTGLDDGVGGALYGTCDPARAFCCVDDGDGCGFPVPGDRGTCAPVADDGAACSFVPLALCATGASCGLDDTCERDLTTPLPVGAPCIDDGFVALGECADGWCDVLESGVCKAPLPLGAACDDAAACGAGVCREGTCAVDTFCRGAP